VDVAVDGTKRILELFEHSCGVKVVAVTKYELGDRLDTWKVVRMPFKRRGKCFKPEHYHALVLSTGPVFYAGQCVSKLAYVREVRNCGELSLYQVKTLSLAINIFQKSNNPFPGVILKHALQ